MKEWICCHRIIEVRKYEMELENIQSDTVFMYYVMPTVADDVSSKCTWIYQQRHNTTAPSQPILKIAKKKKVKNKKFSHHKCQMT